MGKLPKDSGVVDRCSCAVCELDDTSGDGFDGEGIGLVCTCDGGEELKGISVKMRDLCKEEGTGLGPLWDCSDGRASPRV